MLGLTTGQTQKGNACIGMLHDSYSQLIKYG